MFASLARTLLKTISLGMAITVAAGCTADSGAENADATEETSEDLAVGKLNGHFGAAGVLWDNPGSMKIFDELHAAGLGHVRQAAYISFNRYATSIPNDVAHVKATPGADLFIMVHLADCGQPQAACSDILNPDKVIAAAAFRGHFEAMLAVANPGNVLNVKTWGINEPDLNLAHLADAPERAALFYREARDALNAHGCSGCELVAGELAYGATAFTQRYVDELEKLHQKPTTFSMHPYGDVDEAHANDWRTITPSRTERFMKAVREKYPHATFWLTETGRMLPAVKGTPSDEWAAGIFVRERLQRINGVSRVYWWDMAGDKAGPSGSCSWDSALGDHAGNNRASFYGLLGDDEKTALAKSHAANAHPCR
jgi:hypothetical protein